MFTDYDGSTSYDDEDGGGELRASCGAMYTTGPREDPYGTDCIRVPGHYERDDSPHAAEHPLSMPGATVIVTWRGGGSVAGDPVRYADVVTYGRPGTDEPVPEWWKAEQDDYILRLNELQEGHGNY